MYARTVIDRVRSQVSLALVDQLNELAADYEPGDQKIKLKYQIHNISYGTVISGDFNSWYVLAVEQADNALIVIPSPAGEPDFPLTAGTRLKVKPRVTDYQIAQWLNDQIESMSSPNSGLYGIGTWTVPFVETDWTYDIPAEFVDCIDVATVHYRRYATSRYGWFPVKKWRIERGQGYPRLHVLGDQNMNGDLEVVFKMPFGRIATMDSNLVTECFIPASMLDIPILGAAAMFALAAEGQRLQLSAQGDTRRPDEVPGQVNWNYSNQLMRARNQRMKDEAARLHAKYPPSKGRW